MARLERRELGRKNLIRVTIGDRHTGVGSRKIYGGLVAKRSIEAGGYR